jgi:hypothetical protein
MYDVPMPLRTIPILLAASFFAAVAQSAGDSDSALRRTRERLLADLDRLPRYTCVQTITRRYYRPEQEGASCKVLMAAHIKGKDRAKLSAWDRLRLEVAIVDGQNVFSWVGSPRFESGTMERLAGRGPLSNGDFGPFLNAIFTRASVIFQGEEHAGNRHLLAYAYDVPLERSVYLIRGDDGWTRTAYSGVFVIDPENADIVSLTVRTAELPPNSPSCQAISEVEYGRTPIHDRMILIPRETRLTVIDRKGSETHSQTQYASCREYASKTRMLFDGPASTAAPRDVLPAESAPATFPAGLRFRSRIVSTIDSATSAAGDPLDAVLLSPIRDKHKVVLAPAGALVHARLVGFEQRVGPAASPFDRRPGSLDSFQVSIQLESIELKGRTVPLHAAADPLTLLGVSVFRTPVSALSDKVPEDKVPQDVAVFLFRKADLHLKKLEWGWTTLAVAGEQK